MEMEALRGDLVCLRVSVVELVIVGWAVSPATAATMEEKGMGRERGGLALDCVGSDLWPVGPEKGGDALRWYAYIRYKQGNRGRTGDDGGDKGIS